VYAEETMLSRFNTIPERDRRTDGRTEYLYQYRISIAVLTHDKNINDD